MAPPIKEISFVPRHHRKRRKPHLHSIDEKTSNEETDRPLIQSNDQAVARRAKPLPLTKALPGRKSRYNILQQGRKVMPRSEISSLTSWSASEIEKEDETTASSFVPDPSRLQDIFRVRTPPTDISVTRRSSSGKVEVGSPQRPRNTTVKSTTPLRHNRGAAKIAPSATVVRKETPNVIPPLMVAPPVTTNPPEVDKYDVDPLKSAVKTPTDPREQQAASSSVLSQVPSSNHSYSTMGSESLLEGMTKRAVGAVLGGILFDEYSLSAVEQNEVDSYLDADVTLLADEASHDESLPPMETSTQTKKESAVAEKPDKCETVEEESYFETEVDVSSLELQDESTTPLRKKEGMLLRKLHAMEDMFGIKSLRTKINDKAPNDEEIASNTEDRASATEKQIAVSSLHEEKEIHSASDKGSLLSHRDGDSYVDNGTEASSLMYAKDATLPSDGETPSLEGVPLVEESNHEDSGEVVMAVETTLPHRSDDSWRQDGEHHDEEKATKSTKLSTADEPITFRRNFIHFFLIVGVAAIVGGVAAFVASRYQRNNPASAPQNYGSQTLAPTLSPFNSQETSTAPSPSAGTPRPTGTPVRFDTKMPTQAPSEQETLTLRQRIELWSPESRQALDSAVSPQTRALEWALQQPNPSLTHFGLATLRFATNATTGWSNDEGWLSMSNVCEWYGIACRDGKVVQMYLSFNNLGSTLPGEVSLLTDLEVLSISGSGQSGETKGNLVGTIPSVWGERLRKLVVIELYDNKLSGLVPSSLEYLTNLETLNLDGNGFYGPLPPALWSMNNLLSLDLSGNHFLGSVSTRIGLLTNLLHLGLHENDLTGAIPSEIGNLQALNELDLRGNELTGTLPASLYSLSNLAWIDLSRNQLDDVLAPSIGLLNNLEGLLLQENQLGGPLPVLDLISLTNLVDLSLASNRFEGSLPGTFCDSLVKLRHFSFSTDCALCPCCTACRD